jgi:MFS family permease
MIRSAYLAFAVYGAVWGVWGGSVPEIQDQAGVGNGQLGIALLFVGAGGLPAMLLTGRALDHWGLRVAGILIAALGVLGAALALVAVDLVSLSVALALVGAASGAGDVALNAVAGRAEVAAARPVITRAHGFFSSLVVLGSLGTGLAAALSAPVAVPFVVVAVLSLAAGASLFGTLPAHTSGRRESPAPADDRRPASRQGWSAFPFVLVGILGAIALASENAHQSWSAVFAHDELGSGGGLSTIAPAVFAGAVAVTRFSTGGVKAEHARIVILVGAAVAAAGALVVAVAPTLPAAAVGLVLAAAGTAVLYPTFFGIVSRNVDESHRGRATSVVTTISYLGFIVGPVYVGLCAHALGLRAAMVAVAALGVCLVVVAPLVLRQSGLEH